MNTIQTIDNDLRLSTAILPADSDPEIIEIIDEDIEHDAELILNALSLH